MYRGSLQFDSELQQQSKFELKKFMNFQRNNTRSIPAQLQHLEYSATANANTISTLEYTRSSLLLVCYGVTQASKSYSRSRGKSPDGRNHLTPPSSIFFRSQDALSLNSIDPDRAAPQPLLAGSFRTSSGPAPLLSLHRSFFSDQQRRGKTREVALLLLALVVGAPGGSAGVGEAEEVRG